MTHTKTTDWSELKRLAEAATPGPWEILKQDIVRVARDEAISCACTGRGKANAAFIVALVNAWPKVLELIAEVERLRAEPARKLANDYVDQLHSEITALTAQRDEMAEALGWIEAQAKAFAQSKMSEQTRSGIRASAWNWVFAVEQKVADIQRRARSSLNKEKTDG